MEIYINLNKEHQSLQNHIKFICSYIELYYNVTFKYFFGEKIPINKVEFQTSENTLYFEFNAIYFSERVEENLLSRLWQRSFLEINKGLSEQSNFDILAFIFTYMNLRDELYVSDTDRTKYGNVTSYESLYLKKEHYHMPIVDIVIDKFIVKPFNLKLKYQYPTYVRTSDCDSANFKNTFQYGVNVLKTILRMDPVYLDLTSLKGITASSTCHIELFKQYAPGESTVFLPHITGRSAINDVKSHLCNNRIDWAKVKKFADKNVEIGLHASIYSKFSTTNLANSKKYIEEKLEVPIYGCRHHYWNIDWKAPWLTYRKHINAGFKYDAGMALRDIYGFRNGVCRPYKPFDYGRCKILNYYVFPTFLMDSHVYKMPTSKMDLKPHLEKISEAVQFIRLFKGFLIVDWHTETFVDVGPFAGFPAGLKEFESHFVDNTEFEVRNIWSSLKEIHLGINL